MSEPASGRVANRRTLFVEVRVSDEDGVYVYKARNLSEGGMFIDTPAPAEPGTTLEVAFGLPGGSRVTGRAVVRWNTEIARGRVRHPGMGVAFIELAPESAALVGAFLMAAAAP